VLKYVKEQTAPLHGLGGLISSEEQEEYLKHNFTKTLAGGKLLGDNIIFLAYTQKTSAIASGAIPIGSTVVRPMTMD
jgi:hypothetical protein